ncbi:hypothetical protein BDM02DRAFT_2327634 [Thelephora ganbajun]|uniref:Uncharacterized protein n=1 Tax=Thelephora ganbajun TaxID=370292 RepID=A0ACB6YZ30_THEGA|nr:hypothetical protein BDM02DRAFT_2327634 [Thelephora ganbajun]
MMTPDVVSIPSAFVGGGQYLLRQRSAPSCFPVVCRALLHHNIDGTVKARYYAEILVVESSSFKLQEQPREAGAEGKCIGQERKNRSER